jgi:hypothetical protein
MFSKIICFSNSYNNFFIQIKTKFVSYFFFIKFKYKIEIYIYISK